MGVHKRLLISLFIILVLFPYTNASELLSKCPPALAAIYNKYYNQSPMKAKNENLQLSDTLSDSSSAMDSSYYLDSVSNDSSEKIEKPQLYYGKEFKTLGPLDGAEGQQMIEDVESRLEYIDGTPYISVQLIYDGDNNDLTALGVLIFGENDSISKGSDSKISVRFPLSILPQIDRLPTVKIITLGRRIMLNSNPVTDPLGGK